jgi:hypothetical protein
VLAYYAKECDSQGNSKLDVRRLQVAEVCYSGTVNYLRFVLALVRPRLFYSSTTAREKQCNFCLDASSELLSDIEIEATGKADAANSLSVIDVC